MRLKIYQKSFVFQRVRSLRAILQTLGLGLPISQPLTNSARRSEPGRMREEEVVLCWPGSRLLPGLGILAQNQLVCAGLGPGHAPPSRVNRTETAATLGHASTLRVPDLYLPPIPLGGLAATSFVCTVRLSD